MNEQTGQFRSAAFGGFHRQDVLDYLEKLTKEKQELASRLEKETEARLQAETNLAQAEDTAKGAKEAQDAMSGEMEYLRNELEARTASLSRAEDEIKVLRSQVETYRPGAGGDHRSICPRAGSGHHPGRQGAGFQYPGGRVKVGHGSPG